MQLSVPTNKSGKRIKAVGKKKENLLAFLYLLPALLSIAILFLIPVIYTVYLSFTNKDLYHMDRPKYHFVGFQNYITLLHGDLKNIFFPVFVWTIVFAAVATLGGYLLGLFFAMILNNKKMKERNIYKALLIIPWALPGTIATLAWQGLLNEDYGGINLALKALHLKAIPWLTSPTFARIAILGVSIWFTFPYMMNVCLGALQAIPEDYYEAADIDGASRWKKFIKITLPSLASSSYPLIISSFAFNFNNFGAAYLITRGAPARIGTDYAGYTDILASTAYKMTMQFFKYGWAGAMAVMLFIVIASISLIQMKISGQFKEVD